MNQGQRIVELLRRDPDRRVPCGELMRQGLYHKAATRISELNRSGFDIRFVDRGDTYQSYYEMLVDPTGEPPAEPSGQYIMFPEAE